MRWDRILYQKTVLNYLLYPASLIFSYLLRVRRSFYNSRYIKVFQPEVATISVGNIVSGGCGKTPFTIYLAKLLQNAGYRVAVSHRGYKGKYERTNYLISDEQGIRSESSEAGDEPLLIAEALPGIPVIVGKDRSESIRILQREFPNIDYIILDDSFQHLRVRKDFEFVLFNSLTKLGNGFVLPAGILRESLDSLSFADCIVYRGNGEIPYRLKRTGKKIVRIQYHISKLLFPNGDVANKSLLKDKKVVLLSGIGQPDSFEQTVAKAGIEFEKHYRFPDHYSYDNEKVIKKISSEIDKNYDYVLTTEKDFTKLRNYTDYIPLIILAVDVRLPGKEDLLSMISDCRNTKFE